MLYENLLTNYDNFVSLVLVKISSVIRRPENKLSRVHFSFTRCNFLPNQNFKIVFQLLLKRKLQLIYMCILRVLYLLHLEPSRFNSYFAAFELLFAASAVPHRLVGFLFRAVSGCRRRNVNTEWGTTARDYWANEWNHVAVTELRNEWPLYHDLLKS